MELIKCGSTVTIKFNHNTEGLVTAQLMRFDRVTYEVSYFNNGEYKQVWLDESEFVLVNGEKKAIGFR